MARIRSIKPEFWTSEQVMECSTNARLLFIGLWNFCDDAGRMPLSPKRIKAQVFPSDDIVAEDVRRMIDELSANGLLRLYEVDGKEFLAVTGWHHQKIDRPQKSQIPDPPDPNSPNGRRTIGVGREGRGEDRKGDKPGGGGSPLRERAREAPTRHQAEAAPVAEAAVPPEAVAAAPPPAWNSRENFDRVERRCREVLPKNWVQDLVVSPMARLEADGVDLEREIIPALLDLGTRRTPIRTWSLLANTVAERIAAQRSARTAEGLSAVPAAPAPDEEKIDLGSPYGAYTEAVLRMALNEQRRTGAWVEHLFGPAPGRPGCKIPSRLIIGEAA
jgi:hypothetical protein